MYGHHRHMSMHSQITGDEDDGAASESIDNPHLHYDAHVLQDGVVLGMEVAGDVHSDAIYANGSEVALQPTDANNQLTLSFRGQVYVFDSFTHEKRIALSWMVQKETASLHCSGGILADDQMHSVVASFETVVGLQNASPYISFGFKAMSKHFRYLKNAILDQIQHTGKAPIGHNEKDETPRISTTDQMFHSQKVVQNSIFLQHPVWLSQRELPDHAVVIPS